MPGARFFKGPEVYGTKWKCLNWNKFWMCSEYTNFCHAFCFILAWTLLLQLVDVLFLFFHSPLQPFLKELLLVAPFWAIYCASKIIFLFNGSKYHQKLLGTTGNECSGPLFWHERWSCSGFRTRWSLEKSIFFIW